MEKSDKLIDEVRECNAFKQKVQNTLEQANQPRNTGSQANATARGQQQTADPAIKVTGREKHCRDIRIMLRDLNSTENVVGIYGIPGSGKTTLAQYVYQSEEKENHFSLVMWIHVSEIFSVEAIFKQIFEASSPNGDGKNVCPSYSNPETLRREVVTKLQKKRFLLVLDDIWGSKFDNRQSLTEVVSLLKVGLQGSKILVTSRERSSLLALGPDVTSKIIPIPPLDGETFIELLMYYAGVDTRYRGPLYTIGEKIAQKLKGSPLLARLVGAMLSKEHDINVWMTVQNRNHLNGTPGADLWWCYQHLDENIRRCFAFCSIFPRGHRLFRDELVNLWVAEGFIRMTNEGEEMEDVGREYFRELVSSSFLQLGGKGRYAETVFYLVHDLLHDLAVEVAGSDCVRIENVWRMSGNEWSSSSTGDVHPDVRHLFVLNYNVALITGKIIQLEKLRTLIIYANPGTVSVKYEVIEIIFSRLRKLRVLAIAHDYNGQMEEPVQFPESVCQSKHLRHLSFRATRRMTFPRIPTGLYHMQLLNVGSLEFSCGDFPNLRHVLVDKPLDVPNMGNMISLQTLPCFRVSKEQGYEIKQLRDLNKLRGSLSISGLENVTSKLEALEANLAAKERLTKLTLEWNTTAISVNEVETEIEAEVLEGLCPPMRLEGLRIHKYLGLRYPNWMLSNQNGGPMCLQKLVFTGCRQKGPPPQLTAFIYLQTLVVTDCDWVALPDNMEDLRLLRVLFIENCRGIRLLPTLPLSIEEFTLSFCNPVFMWTCKRNVHSNWQKIKHIPKKEFIFPVPQPVYEMSDSGSEHPDSDPNGSTRSVSPKHLLAIARFVPPPPSGLSVVAD